MAPRDVKPHNLEDLIQKLQKADPTYFYGQFDIAPGLVKFKFQIGDLVRPKLIITSSAVLGIKRSEVTLEEQVYEVVKQLAYVTKAKTEGLAYRCRSLWNEEIQVFDQDDLALSTHRQPTA
jgi:hypothetical protein